ncbi:MAG: putative endonuclease [Candidatus Petromonas sp.]|jgi:putative endonuclease|nr:putative endonuclease [Candidatus Petromonas sp.]
MRKKYNWVYILTCGDESMYVGMTNNIVKRYSDHITKRARCKYTRRKDKHPLKLSMCWEVFGTRGDAIKVEMFIKKGKRKLKKQLIKSPQILKAIFCNKTGYELEILPYGDIEKIEKETKILVDKANDSK